MNYATERISDESDKASMLEAQEVEASLAKRAATNPWNQRAPAGFDGKHCVECDDEIPAGRLALGRFNCVYCQAAKE